MAMKVRCTMQQETSTNEGQIAETRYTVGLFTTSDEWRESGDRAEIILTFRHPISAADFGLGREYELTFTPTAECCRPEAGER